MKKVVLLALSLMTICLKDDSIQKDFENYKQSIPGTELTFDMVAIEGGSFQMGSQYKADEQPIREVTISSFWMANHETTWDLYRLFMERNIDSQQPLQVSGTEVQIKVDAVSGATTPYVDMSFGMGTDGYPAIGMTQLAATKFCEWLSAMTGNFYRLPTEAEWEYAAKAGTNTPYSFTNGDALDSYGWHKGNSTEAYHPVGEKLPNPWGLYDMHGNVAEWTLDAYTENYPAESQRDPWQVPAKTYPRVVRGGSWMDEADALRSAARRGSDKSWKKRDPQIPKSKWWHTDAPFVGFRIVRPLETPATSDQRRYWGYQ